MRDLNNLNDMMLVLVDAEQPVRTILADEEVKNLWRGGTYMDMLFYLIREHRPEIFAVIAALDGAVTAEEAMEKYGLSDVVRMFTAVFHSEEARELFALFTAAGKKTGAVSSGSAPENTVE